MRAESAERIDELHGLLRVLVVFHESESLGAGTSVLRAAPDLARRGWTLSGWFPREGPLVKLARIELAAVHTQDRPLASSSRGWREEPGLVARALRTPTYLRSFASLLARWQPHVVHANTLLSLPEAGVARSLGLPVVLHVHEIPPASRKRAATVSTAARLADVLVGVSDAVTSMLRARSGSTPVLTVRNGVPATTGRAERTAEQPFTIGTVGTVSRVKGTDVFVRAAREALTKRPGLRFEHIGAPDLHRDSGLDADIDRMLEGDTRIALLGSRPATESMRQWDVFVLSSRTEGFPLATLEAMALGLPVIATAAGGVPEQLEHLRTGILVTIDDHHAIADWIVRLHDDPQLGRRLGAAAADRVRSDFSVSSQAEGLHHAYLTALNRRFGPPIVRRRTVTRP